MIEAAIALPVIILTAMLMVRLFVYYLEILTAGIEEHRKAIEAQDSYQGGLMRTYEHETSLEMLRGGILQMDVSKKLRVKAYLINEDVWVRGIEVFD